MSSTRDASIVNASMVTEDIQDCNHPLTVEAVPLVEEQDSTVSLSKTAAGAAIAGGIVGTLLLGPVGGIVVCGLSVYATTRSGKVGNTAKCIGDTTYKTCSDAGHFISRRVRHHHPPPPPPPPRHHPRR